MNPLLLHEEGDSSFVKTFNCVTNHFSNCQVSFLYGLLRSHRRILVKKGLIKSYEDSFYYSQDRLEQNIGKPNSPNHILKLLKLLKKEGLIDFWNKKQYPFTRTYKINDVVFHQLEENYGKKVAAARKASYHKREQEERLMPDDLIDYGLEPLGVMPYS